MRVQAEDDHARWPRLARRTDPRHLRKRRMIDIGFIGLGTMGRPMASHLQAAGHRLFLHDVGYRTASERFEPCARRRAGAWAFLAEHSVGAARRMAGKRGIIRRWCGRWR